MLKRLIGNDIRQNKLMSWGTLLFMAVSAMLLALTVLLFSSLTGAINGLMDKAEVPDYMQMHGGTVDEREIARFAESYAMASSGDSAGSWEEKRGIREWQICGFLNLDNSRVRLGGQSLADSTQDNGLCVQGERFDYLLDMENKRPEVFPGEVYVPVCYRDRYQLKVGDSMEIGSQGLTIAGFLRDAQMNSMMASSKRFLVNQADYERLRKEGEEEYLIEFLLCEGGDVGSLSAAYAEAGLPANGPAITRPLIRMINTLSDGTVIFVLLLLSFVVLLISLLCIRFMLLLQMERDRKEVGMLKALGVGKREIGQLYFAKYLLFSGCGGLAGLLAALLLKRPLARQLKELYGADSGGLLSLALAVLAVLLTEGIILSSVRRSLKRTERLSALEALFSSKASGSQTGRGRSDTGPYFRIGLVAAACTLLVLVPQNLYSTMSAPEFVTYMGIGDSEIRMDVRQSESIDQVTTGIAEALSQDTRVERYAVLRTIACPAVLADGEMVSLSVETGDHGIFPVSCQKGVLPQKEGEIALSVMNSRELGVTVGDSLWLVPDGRAVEYRVCGIYSDITNGGKTAKACHAGEGMPAMWSVFYVSLEKSGMFSEGRGYEREKEEWMEQYRQLGAGVVELADYVKETYGQTLEQLWLVSRVVMAVSMLVIFLVVLLFMRMIVEKNRYGISLHKALGFTDFSVKKSYFGKGLLPVAGGIWAGFLAGNLFGEKLCGWILEAFGAYSFRFVISWGRVLALIPAVLLGPAVLAVSAGIGEIRRIGASECCRGRE